MVIKIVSQCDRMEVPGVINLNLIGLSSFFSNRLKRIIA